MTFGRVAEALPRAIRLVGWPKLVIFFFFFVGAPKDHIISSLVLQRVVPHVSDDLEKTNFSDLDQSYIGTPVQPSAVRKYSLTAHTFSHINVGTCM
jgi:hypothetical protein